MSFLSILQATNRKHVDLAHVRGAMARLAGLKSVRGLTNMDLYDVASRRRGIDDAKIVEEAMRLDAKPAAEASKKKAKVKPAAKKSKSKAKRAKEEDDEPKKPLEDDEEEEEEETSGDDDDDDGDGDDDDDDGDDGDEEAEAIRRLLGLGSSSSAGFPADCSAWANPSFREFAQRTGIKPPSSLARSSVRPKVRSTAVDPNLQAWAAQAAQGDVPRVETAASVDADTVARNMGFASASEMRAIKRPVL
jgi:hypothetical protein